MCFLDKFFERATRLLSGFIVNFINLFPVAVGTVLSLKNIFFRYPPKSRQTDILNNHIRVPNHCQSFRRLRKLFLSFVTLISTYSYLLGIYKVIK